jgi:hypothetical protein
MRLRESTFPGSLSSAKKADASRTQGIIMQNFDLHSLGYDDYFEQSFNSLSSAGQIPARIASEQKDRYLLWGNFGEKWAVLSGKLR